MTEPSEQFDWNRTIDNGFERCVWCGIVFGADDRNDDIRGEDGPPGIGGGVVYNHGPVQDKAGRTYDHVGASEPGSYLFHPSCHDEYVAEQRAEQNHGLTEWSE